MTRDSKRKDERGKDDHDQDVREYEGESKIVVKKEAGDANKDSDASMSIERLKQNNNLVAYKTDEEVISIERIGMINLDSVGSVDKSSVKHRVSHSLASAVRYDMSKVEIVRKFNLVTKLGQYIKYQGGVKRINQESYPLHGAGAFLYASSVEMFAPERVFVEHVLNSDFFCGTGDMRIVSNIPMSQVGIRDYGSVQPINGLSSYFNGIMNMLIRVMTDNTVLWNLESTIQTTTPELRFFKSVVLQEPKPSMVIAIDHNNIRWMKNYIDSFFSEGEDRFNYFYGKTASVSDGASLAKKYDNFGVNVDQYYAAIVNTNARYLMCNTDISDRVDKLIKAYALRNLTFDLPDFTSITPFNVFDVKAAAEVIFMSAMLQHNFVDVVLEDNLRYFDACNLFSYNDKFLLHSLTAKKADQSTLINFLSSRIESCDFSYINYTFAFEISPIFYVCTSFPIESNLRMEKAVVLLLEFFLYAITFPNNFDRIKGILQKSFFDIFNALCPSEALTLLRSRGYTYTINDEGNAVYDVCNMRDFVNATDYLVGRYPTIFGDLSAAGVPRIQAIMSLFVPIGEIRKDINAVAAGFPRLDKDPSHYIPFKYHDDGSSTAFSSAVQKFIMVLKKTIAHTLNDDNTSKSSPAYTTSKEFLDEISAYFKEFDLTMHTIVPLHYHVRADSMFNIGDSTKGVFRNFKRVNYCLTSNGKISRVLYKRQHDSNPKFRLSTAVVWQLYGHGTSVLMRRMGCGAGRITQRVVNEQIVIPNEADFIKSALHMYNYFEKLMMPITLPSIIFSDKLFEDIVDKRRIRQILELRSIPNSLLNQVYASVADTMGVDYAQAMSLFDIDGKMVSSTPVCINPTIRRLSLIGSDVLQYDSNVDSHYIENVMCPLSPCVIDRLKIGMSLVVNNPFMRPRKGLRFYRFAVMSWFPDFKPSIPHGAIELVYRSDLIRVQQTQSGSCFAWTIDGSVIVRDFPKCHLVINSLQAISSAHKRVIMDGIKAGWLMVDIPNQFFIPIISTTRVTSLNIIEDIFEKGFGNLMEVPFTDGSGSYSTPLYMPIGNECLEQYIFPLRSITQSYAIGSLSGFDNENPPSGTKLPSHYNLDTGGLDLRAQPIFSDGTYKVGDQHVCMSNVVTVFSKNLIYTDEISYSRDPPMELFSTCRNSNYD